MSWGPGSPWAGPVSLWAGEWPGGGGGGGRGVARADCELLALDRGSRRGCAWEENRP